ncbi:hypothetical protein Q5P01_009186 [Channa striata]|uniref:Uncharacterized protein n=1 Tax=Channa striata TaxID=64152 RepID=A0AA88N0V7_CHASR|nr:hypothetical protein Q5P01_009186 [Channa striata]
MSNAEELPTHHIEKLRDTAPQSLRHRGHVTGRRESDRRRRTERLSRDRAETREHRHFLQGQGLKLLICAALTQKTKYSNGVQRHSSRCSQL